MPKDERRKVSDKHEKQAAKNFGARQHAGSGSGHRQMDMSTETELIECKTVLVGNHQITIKRETVERLTKLAAISDKTPVLHIKLGGKMYVFVSETDWLEK